MPGPCRFRLTAAVLVAHVFSGAVALADDPQGPAAASGGPGGTVIHRLIEHFDRDGNGQLNLEERQAAAADMLKRFDRNRNGKLDADEQTAAIVEFGAKRPDSHATGTASLLARLVDRFDEDRDAHLDEAERKLALKLLSHAAEDRATNRLRTELLRRLDANENGRLDREELDDFIDPPADTAQRSQTNAKNQRADRSAASDHEN